MLACSTSKTVYFELFGRGRYHTKSTYKILAFSWASLFLPDNRMPSQSSSTATNDVLGCHNVILASVMLIFKPSIEEQDYDILFSPSSLSS